MKQFEFEYINKSTLYQNLNKISLWVKSTIVSDMVFHPYKLQAFLHHMVLHKLKEHLPYVQQIQHSV